MFSLQGGDAKTILIAAVFHFACFFSFFILRRLRSQQSALFWQPGRNEGFCCLTQMQNGSPQNSASRGYSNALPHGCPVLEAGACVSHYPASPTADCLITSTNQNWKGPACRGEKQPSRPGIIHPCSTISCWRKQVSCKFIQYLHILLYF